MKKNTLLNLFDKKSLQDNKKIEEEFDILRSYVPEVFSINTDYQLGKIQNNNTFWFSKHNKDLVPFHTRDSFWLAKYILNLIKEQSKKNKQFQNELKKINNKFNQKYPYQVNEINNDNSLVVLYNDDDHTKIKFNTIKKFIETDKEFDNARNQYEVNLVELQIRNLIDYKNCKDNINFNDTNSYHPLFSPQKSNPDKVFYETIVNSMKKIGINQHSIQVGLEVYAPLWRKELMIEAYYNKYCNKETVKSSDWHQLVVAVNFEKLWLQQREYQYYQEHHKIIDELGLATPIMKISEKQADNLNKKINSIDNIHQTIIQESLLKDGNTII